MSTELRKFDKNSFELNKLKKLYKTAFPFEERTPFKILINRTNLPFVDCYSIYLNNEWSGFTYVVSYNNLAYVFYLAIDDNQRGKGIGSQTLKILKGKYSDKVLFLAIEEIDKKYKNYDERVNRKRFYQNNGLIPVDFKITEGPVIYDTMATDDNIEPDDYGVMFDKYLGKFFSKIIKTKMYRK